MPGKGGRAVGVAGIAAAGATLLALTGCTGSDVARFYTGQYEHINRKVVHVSDVQVVEVRNPYAEDLRILEPAGLEPDIWDRIKRPEDTSILIPPGGSTRLQFQVETVTDDAADHGRGVEEAVLPVHYVRESLPEGGLQPYEYRKLYLAQQGPTVRLRLQRGTAAPYDVALSLQDCPARSWTDGVAPQATHRVAPEPALPGLPQPLCPAVPGRG